MASQRACVKGVQQLLRTITLMSLPSPSTIHRAPVYGRVAGCAPAPGCAFCSQLSVYVAPGTRPGMSTVIAPSACR